MIVLISPAGAKSDWVPYEMGFAKGKGITVIPYLLHPKMDVPSFIGDALCLRGLQDEEVLIKELSKYRRSSAGRSVSAYFSEWDSAPVKERLRSAKEVCHQAVSSYTFIHDMSSLLIDFVAHGGLLRCILPNPKCEALKAAARRRTGAAGQLEHLISELDLAKRKLEEIAANCQNGGAVKLKITDFLAEPIMTILDPTLTNGAMYVTLNGFRQPLQARPSFVLTRDRDEKWFHFWQS